jgi:hypothetical protein
MVKDTEQRSGRQGKDRRMAAGDDDVFAMRYDDEGRPHVI